MQLQIRGINVDFPYEPYDVQKIYMEKVIESCQTNHYALLESPTGTGKTLSLICGTLAYVNSHMDSKCSVIYSSRTHSQLRNVVKELKQTKYRPSLVHMASRKHLCINELVNKLPLSVLNRRCSQLQSKKACIYNTPNQISKLGLSIISRTPDFDEFVNLCRENKICPYLTSQVLSSKADFVVSPYNYLISSPLKEDESESIYNGNILIFDEAHNFPDFCTDSKTFEITLSQLSECVSFLRLHSQNFALNDEKTSTSALLRASSQLSMLKERLESLLTKSEFEQLMTDDKQLKYVQKSIEWMIDFFKEANLVDNTANELVSSLKKFLDEDKNMQTPENIINGFNAIIRFFDTSLSGTYNSTDRLKKYYAFCITSKPSICIICMSPSISFNELVVSFPRTIILTSGTLSPLDSFSKDFEHDFPIQLEGSHVVHPSNVFVGIISNGKDNNSFNFTYAHRADKQMKKDLVESINNAYEVIPNGVLTFFSSFAALNEYSPPLKRIVTKKIVITEPTDPTKQQTSLNRYKDEVKGGAVLLAVMRGKLSEGIDFTDDYARGVCVVGVPFPSLTDYKVEIRKNWYDHNDKGRGSKWYTEAAIRAVNQAIGRAIRHKRDYAAILLFDERYNFYKGMLSKWAQKSLHSYSSFDALISDLEDFFRRIRKNGLQEIQSNKIPIRRISSRNNNVSKPKEINEDIEIHVLKGKSKKKPSNEGTSSLLSLFSTNAKQKKASEPKKVSISSMNLDDLLQVKHEKEEAIKCGCCGQEMKRSKLIKLNCGHYYCKECKDNMTLFSQKCFVCNK